MFTQRHIAVQGIDSKMTLFTHSPKYLYSKVEKAYDKLSNIVQRAKAYQTVYQALSHLVIMNERIRIHFCGDHNDNYEKTKCELTGVLRIRIVTYTISIY